MILKINQVSPSVPNAKQMEKRTLLYPVNNLLSGDLLSSLGGKVTLKQLPMQMMSVRCLISFYDAVVPMLWINKQDSEKSSNLPEVTQPKTDTSLSVFSHTGLPPRYTRN